MINLNMLKIKFSGFEDIFNHEFEVDFTAKDRVLNNSLFNIYQSIYSQNVIAITGINASGKTSLLRFLNFAMEILFDNKSLNEIDISRNLFIKPLDMEIIFFCQDKFYRLFSTIQAAPSKVQKEGDENSLYQLEFLEESLYIKPKSLVKKKSDIFDFEGESVKVIKRSKLDENIKKFLKNDSSIVMSEINKVEGSVFSFVEMTNINISGSLIPPNEVISLFDDKIEYIRKNKQEDSSVNTIWEVKYKNKDKVHRCNLFGLQKLLSSGTIKGNNIFNGVILCLLGGGYLIIDEVENHFNKKIIKLLMSIFMDQTINTKGSVLVLSTHYIELLDCLDRKDNLYVLVQNKENRLTDTLRFSDQIKRNDVKKSDIIDANKIMGSAPKYEMVNSFIKFLTELKRSRHSIEEGESHEF